jgi:hypothetical protein
VSKRLAAPYRSGPSRDWIKVKNPDSTAMLQGTMVNDRRFPAPWRADKIPGGYVVRDANGQALVYVYSRDDDAEALQAKVLTKDEARRIAVNVARLPQLLGKAD